MTGLEIAGLVAFCIFVAGWVGLLITCIMMPFNSSSKILNFFFILSTTTFGIAGFSAIIISMVYELMK